MILTPNKLKRMMKDPGDNLLSKNSQFSANASTSHQNQRSLDYSDSRFRHMGNNSLNYPPLKQSTMPLLGPPQARDRLSFKNSSESSAFLEPYSFSDTSKLYTPQTMMNPQAEFNKKPLFSLSQTALNNNNWPGETMTAHFNNYVENSAKDRSFEGAGTADINKNKELGAQYSIKLYSRSETYISEDFQKQINHEMITQTLLVSSIIMILGYVFVNLIPSSLGADGLVDGISLLYLIFLQVIVFILRSFVYKEIEGSFDWLSEARSFFEKDYQKLLCLLLELGSQYLTFKVLLDKITTEFDVEERNTLSMICLYLSLLQTFYEFYLSQKYIIKVKSEFLIHKDTYYSLISNGFKKCLKGSLIFHTFINSILYVLLSYFLLIIQSLLEFNDEETNKEKDPGILFDKDRYPPLLFKIIIAVFFFKICFLFASNISRSLRVKVIKNLGRTINYHPLYLYGFFPNSSQNFQIESLKYLKSTLKNSSVSYIFNKSSKDTNLSNWDLFAEFTLKNLTSIRTLVELLQNEIKQFENQHQRAKEPLHQNQVCIYHQEEKIIETGIKRGLKDIWKRLDLFFSIRGNFKKVNSLLSIHMLSLTILIDSISVAKSRKVFHLVTNSLTIAKIFQELKIISEKVEDYLGRIEDYKDRIQMQLTKSSNERINSYINLKLIESHHSVSLKKFSNFLKVSRTSIEILKNFFPDDIKFHKDANRKKGAERDLF